MVSERRSTSVSFLSYPDLENPKSWIDSNINYCNYDFGYKIKLKGEKLLVKLTSKPSHMHLLSNRSEEFLAEWLRFSPATIVQIDSRIELENLNMWANQCRSCRKAVFLRLSKKEKFNQSSNHFFNGFNKLNSFVKRCLDIFAALISIIILAPVFIAVVLLIKVHSQEPILQTQWCVGKQGRLFCIYNFSENLTTMNLGALTKLPQLFNILKGDMSFVGRFPWSLAEVRKISLSKQLSLNILPGITAIMTGNK